MSRRDAALLAALLALAFALRAVELSTPARRWGDERVHVPAAVNYWEAGQTDPDFWEHPPLRHLLLRGSLALLGDGPWGWRLRNVLSGALTAVLVALLAFAVDRSRVTAAVAGLLIATDPLHVVASRLSFDEVYGTAFFVGAVVAFLRARGRIAPLLVSGLLVGCALATKWHYVPGWLLLAGLALRQDHAWRRPADAALVLAVFVCLPLLVYAASFAPWFGRGYSVGELVELTTNAYFSLQHMDAGVFNPAWAYLNRSSPLAWFVAPVMFGQAVSDAGASARFFVFGNNLFVWGLTLPSLALCAWTAVRRRSVTWGLPVLLFAGTWAVHLLARRPAFIYSAIPLLPFAFTAIALASSSLAQRFGRRTVLAAAASLVASNLYLVPLATGRAVPVALYRPVLGVIHRADAPAP